MTTVLMSGPSAITTSFASCKCMMDFKMVVAGSLGVPLARPTLMNETAAMQDGWILQISTTLTSTSTT
ncbi:hypothetical protein HU200_008076 [Digitaria exilis]|uniref:Uncharacterized protein n=1 Tax=Digitaria exilis TaxID=1010633 RepID=A0A835KTM8_9POAL|nr:hypothetical protein HU200_008076 [Digitaria exilis]